MQGIFQKENTDKALKYGIYRHLPTYEKIIRNLVSFLIKNGYGDMVVMSMETYEKNMFIHDVEKKLAEAEEAISKGQVGDARKALSDLRKQYEL